jgi:hypothetical protein
VTKFWVITIPYTDLAGNATVLYLCPEGHWSIHWYKGVFVFEDTAKEKLKYCREEGAVLKCCEVNEVTS